MNTTKLALLLVVFVDLMGQGLIFPIIDTLMLSTERAFLPEGTSQSDRQFNYGLVMAVFYLFWFLGAAYLSKLSDMIGRKNSILICLFGAFLGYALTILALFSNSLWLLVLGRAVTGFTAGNQPIAQAALVDLSTDDTDRARNMGYVMVAVSAGLIAGPIIGGILSDTTFLGGLASLKLPFYVAGAMVAATIVLIALSYSDAGQQRQPFRFEPLEIFLVLWRIAQRPVILRISLVFFFFEITLNAFYIFMDTYLTSRFHYGTFPTSMAMMVFGGCLALSGAFLVPYFGERITKRAIVFGSQVVIGLSCLAFVFAPVGLMTFLPIAVIGVAFGVGYPTLLAIYSLSVDEDEQGWVMGVSIALFTIGSGITSFAGGEAMGIDIRLPFYYAAGIAVLTLVLIAALWSYPALRSIVAAKPEKAQARPAETKA